MKDGVPDHPLLRPGAAHQRDAVQADRQPDRLVAGEHRHSAGATGKLRHQGGAREQAEGGAAVRRVEVCRFSNSHFILLNLKINFTFIFF